MPQNPTGLIRYLLVSSRITLSDITAIYLTHIYDCSLSSGIFPDDWKKARVSPIFKSGNKEECGNYRPISVLSVVAKIFEKLVCGQLSSYLKEENILTKYQSGFWRRSFNLILSVKYHKFLVN